MSFLSAADFSREAGIPSERVDALVLLGLLPVAEGEAPFAELDVERVRLVEALEVSGIPLERLAQAVRDGRIPLGQLEGVSSRPIAPSDRSIREIAAELEISLDSVAYVYAMWGLSAPDADEPLRADDAALWDVFASLYQGRIGNLDGFIACNRIFAEGIRKVVDGVTEHLRADFEAGTDATGVTPPERLVALSDEARRVSPLVFAIAQWGLGRFLEHTLTDYFVALAEASVDGDGRRSAHDGTDSSILFLDLSGFTAFAEQHGDAEAAHKAAALGRLVQETAHLWDGRLVKLLGDGAMLHFADATNAVSSGLDFIARVSALDLPAARVGIAAGPVVRKDGDFFGRTVNLAARIADYARPGEVLVNASVADSEAGDGVTYDVVGPVELKGISGRVAVYAAARPRTSPGADIATN